MKNLALVTGLLTTISVTAAQAQTECSLNSDTISKIEIQRDGGEETLSITSTEGQKARLLVLRNHGGVTIAIVDNALTGSNVNSGLMIAHGNNGSATVAVNGQILKAQCENK